jgi:hypothetical protein
MAGAKAAAASATRAKVNERSYDLELFDQARAASLRREKIHVQLKLPAKNQKLPDALESFRASHFGLFLFVALSLRSGTGVCPTDI